MSFLKSIAARLRRQGWAYLFFCLSCLSITFLHSARWAYDWIAELYPLGEKFVPTLFGIMGACATVNLVFFLAGDSFRKYRWTQVLGSIFDVLAIVLFAYSTVLLFGLDSGISALGLKNGATSIIPNLPYLGLAIGLPFVFVLYPKLKKNARIAVAIAITAVIVVPLLAVNIAASRQPFVYTAQPLVLDIGGDNYSIVCATNRASTAYLNYSYDGAEISLPDATAGRMNVSRIHHFIVPRDNINQNSYSITAYEVRSSINANTEFGTKITTPTYNFKGEYKDNLDILIASDWHDMPDKLASAAANFNQPDLFIMLGDAASNYNSEDEFIINTIYAGALVTKSETPAIYVRGNHELYGEMTDIILPNLGLDKFYYQVERGKYLFTICDSAEGGASKTLPTPNTKGSVNTENKLYHQAQLDWLNALPVPSEDTLHFAAVHIPEFNTIDSQISTDFYAELEHLQVRAQFSGHEHFIGLFMPEEEDYSAPYPLLIDGGPKDGGYTGDYVCSFVSITESGQMHLQAYDSTGEKMLDKTLQV